LGHIFNPSPPTNNSRRIGQDAADVKRCFW
jgi:hypothetical protein